MAAYYNEIDQYAAQWLRHLIQRGIIPPGEVDTRSILDVRPDDLKWFDQCHFFAGIGGWSIALRLAGWPDNRPVWTGSCPCQPFSTAGRRTAQSDERHLWPVWSGLIGKCRPPTIFGEQVAAAVANGWWDDVAADLEAKEYACAATILPACSVGAPHRRERLWFMADSDFHRNFHAQRGVDGETEGLPEIHRQEDGAAWQPGGTGAIPSLLADADGRFNESGSAQRHERRLQEAFLRKGWYSHDWNTEPAVGRVADGVPLKSHKLRAYGNAIVPQVAAEFIESCGEIICTK